MKHIALILIIGCVGFCLWGAKWETITNTTHIYDLLEMDTGYYMGTWGGMVFVSKLNTPGIHLEAINKVWTTADGLVSNDVRNISYIQFNQSIWLGSASDGITIINQQGMQKLTTELGLPSNNVVKIVEKGSNVLVATQMGLANYYYLEGVNFPLQLHQYNVQNTPGLLSNNINAMELASNNYLFISTDRGLNFVHLDSLDVDDAWHSLSGARVKNGHKNKLSIGGDKLIVTAPTEIYCHSIDPYQNGWTHYTSANGLINQNFNYATIDANGDLWVSYGTWDEDILAYNLTGDILLTRISSGGAIQHLNKKELGLGTKCISKIICTDDGIYLCSWGDGIFYQIYPFNPAADPWQQYLQNTIGFPKIRNIVTDAQNAIWFSSGAWSIIPQRKSSLGACRYKDGIWRTYNLANSPIHTDNVYTVEVDSKDRKWFGTFYATSASPTGWKYGVSIFDEVNNQWFWIMHSGMYQWNETTQSYGGNPIGTAQVMGDTDVGINCDKYGNMFIACCEDGFTVLSPEDEFIRNFTIPNSVRQAVEYSYHNGRQYFVGTHNDRGLVIWNDDSIPESNGNHWLIPDPPELNNCEVYGVVTIESPYEGTQHWIAASNGLFMWDETDWYKYDTAIKRYKYNKNTHNWENNILYFVDEERLFGSVRTTPTAIYLDPFNRIWIGSLQHGLTMYDPLTERFTNYYQENSPLLSNYITALGYNPEEGKLLIGTPEGLNTLIIGYQIKPETTLTSLKIYPNPFYPEKDKSISIINYPSGTLPRGNNKCRIYDSSGALVITLKENEFARFDWDGLNSAGKKCATGIYYVVVMDEKGNRKTGKIALLR